MNPTKKQLEIITSEEPLVIISSLYGAGSTTTLAMSALARKSALVIDIQHHFFKSIQYPAFTSVLEGNNFSLNRKTETLTTNTSTIKFRTINKLTRLCGYRSDIICIDNFEMLSNEEAEYTLRKVKNIIRNGQIYISINPLEINNITSKALLNKKKYELKTSENEFLPKSFSKDIHAEFNLANYKHML